MPTETSHANERGSTERSALPPHPDSLDSELSFGQRVADKVAAVAGSWTFILLFLGSLVAWMTWNSVHSSGALDPFPFILLNLILSCVAALQAPVIMMSQNRSAVRDRRQADLDYRINVIAEKEIVQLKREMDELRRQQLAALFTIQQEQLVLLRSIAECTAVPKGEGRRIS